MEKKRILLVVLALGILIVWRQLHKDEEAKLVHLTGQTMGVVPYSVKYLDMAERDYKEEIDSLLAEFNHSLSTYIYDSEVSEFNRVDSLNYRTSYFFPMLSISKEIYDKSNGAFDPTIGPLVNAWGFGPEKKATLDSALVDSLLMTVGFDNVLFDNKKAAKLPGVYLDFSATAKGYAVDVVAAFLEDEGIHNFMVEIGGEVVCSGKNDKNNYWKIGIEKPDMSPETSDIYATTFVKNTALATSGNYRNYYQENGRIISHTISPYTGYSIRHNLLSASIYAPSCALADGYATACMVLGVDQSIAMIEANDELEGLLIFSDEKGNLNYYASEGIASIIEIVD